MPQLRHLTSSGLNNMWHWLAVCYKGILDCLHTQLIYSRWKKYSLSSWQYQHGNVNFFYLYTKFIIVWKLKFEVRLFLGTPFEPVMFLNSFLVQVVPSERSPKICICSIKFPVKNWRRWVSLSLKFECNILRILCS